MDIKNFSITIENSRVYMAYGIEKYSCDNIAFVSENLPCIPIRVQNGRKEYINFFKGRYIVPDFVSIE